jgi:hypothetical protein
MFFCPPEITCPPLPLLLTRSKIQAPVSVPLPTGRYQCPSNLASLTPLLLRDLPSYANRAAQSRRRSVKDPNYTSYILAGQPDLNPIAITNPEYSPAAVQSSPQQLFISTLEKQFSSRNTIEQQRFHWLFLTQNNQGNWYLALMYSRLGKNAQNPKILPPLDSSQSPLGEAVSTWLRDCRAGQIKP